MPIDFTWMFYEQQAINETLRKDNRPVRHGGRGCLRLEERVFSMELQWLTRVASKNFKKLKAIFSYFSHEFKEKFQS